MNLYLLLIALLAILPVGKVVFDMHGVRRLGVRRLVGDLGDIVVNVPAELRGKSPDELRAIASYLGDALASMNAEPDGSLRMLDDADQERFDEGFAMREAALALLKRHDNVSRLADVPGHVERVAPNVNVGTRTAIEVYEDRSATPSQVVDAATRALEDRGVEADALAHVRKILIKHTTGRKADPVWARNILARSTPEYVERFFDAIEAAESDEVRTVLGVSTNANGKYMVPTHLDPTIILTNAGSQNIMRQLARQETLTKGNVWHGITSAGVTASWDGEVVEVSDDTPTVGNPSVSLGRAQVFAQASLSAVEDIEGIGGELLKLFADARERLEGAGFTTGAGTGVIPRGIFTALNANTNVQYISASAAAIALADIQGTYGLVPERFRKRGSWLMHSKYDLAIKALGTAVSASFTSDLAHAPTSDLLGRPKYVSDDCPSTQTTTALDNEVIYGDFSNYLIVDKPGSFGVQYIPTLFNTANNLPDGRVGWYATWRAGGDSLVDTAFALLVDKTSA